MKRFIILVISIFIVGAFLRFNQLGNAPIGFHRDEAFLGYNAYSILQTGKDMTGHVLPVHLESFLYSPAGYSYASIPFIAFFGLSAFAVRFAAAFFGSVTLLLVPFFVNELFYKRKDKYTIALLTEFILAISPWHINLSRVATENVLVVFFITLGVYLYLLWNRLVHANSDGIASPPKWLIAMTFLLSFLSFGLTLTIYQAPRAFLPLLLPCLFLFSLKKIKSKQMAMSLAAFFLVIIIPVLAILHSPQLSVRIHMLSIFQNPQTQLVLNEQIREDGVLHPPIIATRLFHNKAVGYASIFLQNYFQHFSYQFLFTDSGFPDRYRISDMGLLYIFELPCLLLGGWFLLTKEKRIAWFLLAWVFLAPVGSALTYDDIPNLQRTLLIFPALAVISALGLNFIWNFSQKRFSRLSIRIACCFVIIYSLCFYMHAYYYHAQIHRPWFRDEGFPSLIATVNSLSDQYKSVMITQEQSDPAILFLFYNKVDPAKIQDVFATHPTTAYGNIAFDKYVFSKDNCPLDTIMKMDPVTKQNVPVVSGDPDILYVDGASCKIPQSNVELLATIRRPDRSPAFFIMKFKK